MEENELCRRVSDVRERMRVAGDKGQVLLLPAVKYASVEQINTLHRRCGINDFGENRVQQLLEHYEKLEDRENVRIHFIGSLQTNKVKAIVDKVCMIHSLDSDRLAAEIDRQCGKIGRTMDVLVEINSGEEENKGGVLPAEAEEFCLSLTQFPHLRLRGFMTMAPKCENSDDYFKFFSQTYRQCLDIWQKKSDNIEKEPIFSMGMSSSFETAIRAGATIVRVGGLIFRE